MAFSAHQQLRDLLAADDLSGAIALLEAGLGAEHPDRSRIRNLEKRLRQLEGRVAQGTLAPEEVARLRRRIAGGLGDVISHPTPPAPPPIPEEQREAAATPRFRPPPAPPEPTEEPAGQLGYRGEIVYSGSPSQQSDGLVLPKSYGATYHAAVQAIRKCGMTMESGDRAGGRISASAPGNAVARFGERVELWILPEERGHTRVRVTVDSANPDTVFDLGRHRQKLSALLHQLRNA